MRRAFSGIEGYALRGSMFPDQSKIKVAAGKGGDGCSSFRKEKFVNRGGPDGGSGGSGGDVIIRCDKNLSTLLDFRYKSVFRAGSGAHGRGKNKDGRKGEDLVIRVPPGTVLINESDGNVLADLVRHGQDYTAATGGKGGRGNSCFKSPVNRAPRTAETGGEGGESEILLELKLMAEVGIIGCPNAGKSSLVRIISNAEPKVADYPFTTIRPAAGVVDRLSFSYTVAEIPGLIRGAHTGKGLGDRFLRHIERSKFILHLVDLTASPVEDFRAVSEELRYRGFNLPPESLIVAGNKMDIPEARRNAEVLKEAVLGIRVFFISCLSGDGIDELMDYISELVRKSRDG